jgi:hypothetical protein
MKAVRGAMRESGGRSWRDDADAPLHRVGGREVRTSTRTVDRVV